MEPWHPASTTQLVGSHSTATSATKSSGATAAISRRPLWTRLISSRAKKHHVTSDSKSFPPRSASSTMTASDPFMSQAPSPTIRVSSTAMALGSPGTVSR